MNHHVSPLQALDDIQKITIPFDLPNGPGPINVYLLCGSPLTLIDSGIKGPRCLEYIREALAACGYRLEEIERIYLTHGHLDHFGGARAIRAISGADIYIHPLDRAKAQLSVEALFETEMPLIRNFFRDAGVPDSYWDHYHSVVRDLFETLADPIPGELKPLTAGQILPAGRRYLEVLHLPGHTPGTVCFYDEAGGVLFSGDHLLAAITPNPLVELAARADNGYRSLKSYLASLKRIKAIDARLVLPGHGDLIYDHRTLADRFIRHHEGRKEQIYGSIAQAPKTRWELAGRLFGDLTGQEVFLGLSEVQGHLDILWEENRIRRNKKGDCFYYRANMEALQAV